MTGQRTDGKRYVFKHCDEWFQGGKGTGVGERRGSNEWEDQNLALRIIFNGREETH